MLGKIFGRVFPARGSRFLFVHRQVRIFGCLCRNHLQHRPAHRSNRQRPQNIPSRNPFCTHRFLFSSPVFCTVLSVPSRAPCLCVVFFFAQGPKGSLS